MPIVPTNVPSFYTAMMKDLKDTWDALFIHNFNAWLLLDGAKLVVNDAQEEFLNDIKVMKGRYTIIDDILWWRSNIELILIYFGELSMKTY